MALTSDSLVQSIGEKQATRGAVAAALVAAAVWTLAILTAWLHISAGPSAQRIGILWASGLSDGDRIRIEEGLELDAGEPGKYWNYLLENRSAENIRAILSHPFVVDTRHLDSSSLRVQLDQPAMPEWLRSIAEADRLPLLSLMLTLLGIAAIATRQREVETLTQIMLSRARDLSRKPAAASTAPRLDAWTLFAWMWAAGVMSHLASYQQPMASLTVVMFAAALYVLFRPSNTAVFLGLLAVQLVDVYEQMPRPPNHLILAACVALTILSAALWQAVAQRAWRVDRARLYSSVASVVRIELLVVYFFAVFHKLNSGFFSTEHGCGAEMYLRLAEHYPILPTADWARASASWMTVLIEGAILVMLIVRRLRFAGLLLAVGFHFALAIDPGDVFFNFSAFLLALFSLFLPDDFAPALPSTLEPLRRLWHGQPNWMGWMAVRTAVYVGLPAVLVALIWHGPFSTELTEETARGLWVLYAGFILSAFLATRSRRPLVFAPAIDVFATRSPWLLVFPALLAANGFMPYLGGKTETSFAMFSNLRTEASHTNHWFMPVSLQILDYQRDVVTVHRTSVGWMQQTADAGYQWTYFEFRRLMSELPEESVTYERNGIVRSVARIGDDPELMRNESAALRKILGFRQFSIDPSRSECTH